MNSTRPKPTHASNMIKRPNTAKPQGCFSDGNCFVCLLRGAKIQENNDDISAQVITRSPASSSINSRPPDHEAKVIKTRKRRAFPRRGKRGRLPKKLATLDPWQPSLESIKEE